MMPSSTAILESVARKGAQINRAPYNVETWNQPGLAPAAKLVKIRNSQLRPMNSLRGGKNSLLPPRKFPAPQGQGIRHKLLELLSQVKSEQRNLRGLRAVFLAKFPANGNLRIERFTAKPVQRARL
jgi:hypothetical protein